jgi:L-seryl-tRNA(Ser) seleniumtransferase
MIPSVESLLTDGAIEQAAGDAAHRIVVECVREAVEEARRTLAAKPDGEATAEALRASILRAACRRIRAAAGPYHRRVVNATGIILHSGLGRAVLAPKALQAIQTELAGYNLLQVDVETGERTKRDRRIEWMLQQLTGAEAATLVNNNAAGTSIALNTIAKGKEVIVSRGQLVEIGGSFRLPDVMASSGVKMVEVGTTNKTHPKDYERAITPETAAILRVHPSNYKVVGFTEEVPVDQLAEIAHAHNLTMIDDIGSGALLDFARLGFPDEPMIARSLQAGADVVLCSTDKLIGASQGGLILGKTAIIEAIRKNPMVRILRVGKLTLAVLEASLSLFFDEATALKEVPTLEMFTRDLAAVSAQAERIAAALRDRSDAAEVVTADGASQTGGGSLPAQDIPTRLVSIVPRRMTPDTLALALRRHEPPIFARIREGALLLDPRTLREGEAEIVVEAVAAALQDPSKGCHAR